MDARPRPRLVVSRCLELDACRYNAQTIRARIVTRLEPFVELLPVCPEVEIGLGVPRDPIRLVKLGGKGDARLVQPSTGRDLTEAMDHFGRSWLDGIGEVDGFLLKSRSPSCGPTDAKVFAGVEHAPAVERGAGAFAALVLERFPGAAVEDEGRLTNLRIREHFLTKVFTVARLREAVSSGAMRALVGFHARHKLLLMGYGQAGQRRLGRVVANPEKRPFAEVVATYRRELAHLLAHPPRTPGQVNVLTHALGYFKRALGAAEKQHFLDILEEYRSWRLPLSAPLALAHAWLARFEEPYLASQVYFEPFPRELVDLGDSGSRSRPG